MRKSSEIMWYSTIRMKLLATIILTITFVLGIASISAYTFIKAREQASLEKLAEVSASRLSRHLILPMWGLDREQVGYLLSAEMEEERVSGIVVRDQDGITLFAAKVRVEDGSIVDTFDNIQGDLVNVDKEVVYDGQTIGHVSVFLTNKFMNRELKQFGLAVLAIVVGLNVIIGFIMIMVFGRVLIRPITILTKTAENISRGILSQEMNIKSKDELGHLAGTLLRMQSTIAVAVRTLEDDEE